MIIGGGMYLLCNEEVERFAEKDPKIKSYLEVFREKEMLELALEKMEG